MNTKMKYPGLFEDCTDGRMCDFMEKNFYKYSIEDFQYCYLYAKANYYPSESTEYYKGMWERREKQDLLKLWIKK